MGKYRTTLIEQNAEIAIKPKVALYNVYLLNDDKTPVDFVESIIIQIFHMSAQKASKMVHDIEESGQVNCGVYTYDVAETIAAQIMDCAKRNKYPLKCKVRKH